MQPPIHISSDPSVNWIIFVVGCVAALYWLRALRLAREGARLFLRNVAKAILVFVACALLIPAILHVDPKQSQFWSLFIAFVAWVRWQSQKRSRYISAKTKRAVIARDLKGEKYDSSKHHIDHVWPHSRGGSNTSDNLRVIEKTKNLKKGAKRPGIREMW
ncbi:MAG TPA: HNH endonuclease [Bryobacteraceae bacterium]|nr:HNH endonuclease [Bryobacteraceae bacterium]